MRWLVTLLVCLPGLAAANDFPWGQEIRGAARDGNVRLLRRARKDELPELVEIAAGSCQPAAVRLLLARGAPVGDALLLALEKCSGQPAAAARVVAVLLNRAEIDHRNADGRTALMMAAGWGPAMAGLVLARHPQLDLVDSNGDSALLAALSAEEPLVAAELLRRGAKLDGNHAGETPIHLAVTRGYLALIDVMLAAGASIETKSPTGQTLLLAATRSDVVAHLLAKGAAVGARDANGDTALIGAARRYDLSSAKALIAAHIALDAQNSKGQTALMATLCCGGLPNPEQIDIVALLLANRASQTLVDDKGRTALMLAADEGATRVALMMLDHGAAVDTRDLAGKTAWIHAHHWSEYLPLALEARGAKPTAADRLAVRQSPSLWLGAEASERRLRQSNRLGRERTLFLWSEPAGSGRRFEVVVRDESRLDASRQKHLEVARLPLPIAVGDLVDEERVAALPLDGDDWLLVVPVETVIPAPATARHQIFYVWHDGAFRLLRQFPSADDDTVEVIRDHGQTRVELRSPLVTLSWDGKALEPMPAVAAEHRYTFEAFNRNGDPIVNARYEATSPTGEVHRGRVGRLGKVVVRFASDGPYSRTWPEYHTDEPF